MSRRDLVVVGGGIYGVTLALEAARRGLATTLVERGRCGAATSANTLHILHGGLRYLQRLDLARFRESVAERRWFLAGFPELVAPLPCLLPLDGHGLRRPLVLRLALAANDLLSRGRNRDVPPERALPAGRLLSAAETAAIFPGAARRGDLAGGALWHDAVMLDPPRLVDELVRRARRLGAEVLEETAAEALLRAGERAAGVAVRRRGGERSELAARAVVNCAGPWARSLARAWDRDLPRLFAPCLGFNLLLDRPPLAEVALALAPPAGGRALFLLPWRGKVLAGTAYAPRDWAGEPPAPRPSDGEVAAFLAELAAAAPELGAAAADVLEISAGVLPARAAGGAEPADRPVLHDHGAAGGPRGLWSVSGVKFTTARRVALVILARVFGRAPATARAAAVAEAR